MKKDRFHARWTAFFPAVMIAAAVIVVQGAVL